MKKNRSYQQYQEKKRKISGKTVVGIDPAKEKHQVTVVDGEGLQVGGSFSILLIAERLKKSLLLGNAVVYRLLLHLFNKSCPV